MGVGGGRVWVGEGWVGGIGKGLRGVVWVLVGVGWVLGDCWVSGGLVFGWASLMVGWIGLFQIIRRWQVLDNIHKPHYETPTMPFNYHAISSAVEPSRPRKARLCSC